MDHLLWEGLVVLAQNPIALMSVVVALAGLYLSLYEDGLISKDKKNEKN